MYHSYLNLRNKQKKKQGLDINSSFFDENSSAECKTHAYVECNTIKSCTLFNIVGLFVKKTIHYFLVKPSSCDSRF